MEIDVNGVLLKVNNEDIKNGKFRIPKEVKRIGNTAFYNCNELVEIVIPKGLTQIGSYAFVGCTNLSNITIPESVTSIGWGAFKNCTSLEEISIPKGVHIIKGEVFRNCTNLVKISIPKGVTYIGESAFGGCVSLSNIIISKGLTQIGKNAFNGCHSLSNVVIPDGVTQINDGAFSECTNLSKISLPNSLTKIECNAFKGCTSLSEITIPENVTKIDWLIFSGCTNLLKVTLPEGLKEISISAFRGCSNLSEINVKKQNFPKNENNDYKYMSIDGVLFYCDKSTNSKILIKYPNGRRDLYSYTIPNDTVCIDDFAFEGCNGVREIVLPNSVEEVGTSFFEYTNVAYDADNNTVILKNEIPTKSSKHIPIPYLNFLISNKQIEEFIKNADFRAFNSHLSGLELLYIVPNEEQLDFFKFAVCLGCFSNQKVKDKNGQETEETVGQKASALLAKLIKTPQLKLEALQYHHLFNSLPYNAKASQDFLNFITPQGKKNENIELLIRLENEYPGIFTKTMIGFEKAKEYRNTISENGETKVLSWEEALKKFYVANKYVGVTQKTQDAADIYASKGLEQKVFDEYVGLRAEAESKGIPEHILGKEIRELSILERIEELKQKTGEELANSQELIDDLYSKQFTFEWLNKNDPKNGILGLYVSCCGTITNPYYGKNIAKSSIIKKNVQNLVIRDAKGEIVSKGTLYLDEEHGYGVFNDFELNEKYREHEIKNYDNIFGGIYAGDEKAENELSESERNERKERDLIFSAFIRGIQAFVDEYDAQHPDKPLQQINVGMGYNRLKRNVREFETATELLTVPGEYGFEDARKRQHILYKREEKEIKNNKNEEKERRVKYYEIKFSTNQISWIDYEIRFEGKRI